MSKSKAIAIKMSNLKFFLSDFISHNKFKIIIGLFVILIGVLTGIFTALKSEDCKLLSFDYLIYDFVDGELHTLPVMLSRLLSCEVVFVIISISAITIFLIPIGYFVIIYRSYLVGFNATLLIVSFGLTGCLSAIIIFVCQLVILIIMTIYFSLLLQRSKIKRKFGCLDNNMKFLNIFLLFNLILILVIILETLLFFIFRSKVILSI